MTPKRKTDPEPLPPSDLYRLGEIIQMRRVERHSQSGPLVYYICQLCSGRSETATGEIRHEGNCPLNRLKK